VTFERLVPMRQFLKEVASRMTAQLLCVILFPLLSSIAIWAFPKVQSWIDTLVPLSAQGRVAGVLFVLLSASVAWIFILHKRLSQSGRHISEDYQHMKDRGFWVNRKTGDRVCGNCILSGIVSPLSAVRKTRRNNTVAPVWRCGRTECDKSYSRHKDDT